MPGRKCSEIQQEARQQKILSRKESGSLPVGDSDYQEQVTDSEENRSRAGLESWGQRPLSHR